MATLSVEHPNEGLAPQARRSSSGLRRLWVLQLVFWSLLAASFFALLRSRHPFPTILLGETAATAATGLACSAVLERLHALLHARSPRFAAFVGIPLGSLLLGLAWYALADWLGDVLDPFVYTPVFMLPGGELYVPLHMPAFAAILLFWSLLFLALVHWRDERAQKERLLRAEALAELARLHMLRYQLNPHFLFNALNSIGALANEAPHRVQRMVGELSGFLRYSLLDSERLEVPLGDELRAVTHYLEVEKVRFEDDLEVHVELEPAAAKRTLPAFLVLPLVDNAIKHGQRTSAMPLRIEVAGRIESGALHIDVKNTGKWVAASQPALHAAGTDTGLHNVRERLQAHYPGRHAFDVYEDGGWVRARIRIDDAR
jgi:two-component system, LytTR family, sensor kinase